MDKNAPAFPVPYPNNFPGLSKREYFAALAMAGNMACDLTPPDDITGEDIDSMAKISVMAADALCKALKAKQ